MRAQPGSLTCSAYSTVTRDLSLTSHSNFSWPARDPNLQPIVT